MCQIATIGQAEYTAMSNSPVNCPIVIPAQRDIVKQVKPSTLIIYYHSMDTLSSLTVGGFFLNLLSF